MHIVVIGSGFGGLAAAVRLQAQGHQVTIVEKRDKPGGRAYVFEQDGFTFDAGPTIITAPWLLDELFALNQKKTADYVTLVPVDPFYNIRFEDGSVFRYAGTKESVLEEIRKFNPADVPGYISFLEKTSAIYEAGFRLIDQPFSHVTDMIKVLPDLVRLRADKSVAEFVEEHIRDERLRQVFSFHPLLIGGNPFDTTLIYALIHTLEQRFGVWFAKGGTGALVRALVRLFEDMGGTLLLNSEAKAIHVAKGRASGVEIEGRLIPADAVVSNADVVHTYERLLPMTATRRNNPERLKRMRQSMSLFVLYFGTDRQYPDTAHHEILMGPRYRDLLFDIFDRKVLADDFSLYLHRPTATDPNLAPAGQDAWYVLSPVPNLQGSINWATASDLYADRIISYLEERYLPDLSKHIVTSRYIDPIYFQNELNSYQGSAFSVEPILTQSAWMRPHNQSEDVPNLYLVGAGTHPGAGLPGVISSGKLVANLIGKA